MIIGEAERHCEMTRDDIVKLASEQHLEMVNAPAPSVPVLTVKCEPDYWSGGHYYEGTKPYIAPTAVWKLPIGTKLYTAPAAPEHDPELVRDAERYRWLRFALSDKSKNGKSHHLCSIQRGHPEELDAAIDAARAAQKGASDE